MSSVVRGKVHSRNIARLIEEGDRQMLRKVEQFRQILARLKYEGEPLLGGNVKRFRGILNFFNSDVMDHILIEEKVLFPFLKFHIPKMEMTIHLLLADHEDFKRDVRVLGKLLTRLERSTTAASRSGIIGSLQETGMHLVYLLRHHVDVESKSIYRDERLILQERLRKMFSRFLVRS